MPMIKCRECGKDVSSQAASCPHCGIAYPAGQPVIPEDGPTPAGSHHVAIGCAAVVLLGLGTCVYMMRTTPTAEDMAREEFQPRAIQQPTRLWVTSEAMDQGTSLVQEGVAERDPARLRSLIACTVRAGDTVQTQNVGSMRRRVLVLAGPHRGCSGWMAW